MNPFINQVASKDTIELLAKFFDAASKSVKRFNYSSDILEAFDLIQAISCFRYFPTVEQCIEAFPSLLTDKHKVEYIWEQFKKLSSEQLSDVYIESLSKLDFDDELVH
ncbi:MAG: hypothetical protein A3B68_02700 [Candidatus Melainabacteria bacterium RIFCSPHIGHO2_02_FULL_34_12]|nr:MAG: hypothetical protein A3B68_02700 [Candidatus Melainabacteria bacterium RIFCSPHIGHO2_02_FULL_34_12]